MRSIGVTTGTGRYFRIDPCGVPKKQRVSEQWRAQRTARPDRCRQFRQRVRIRSLTTGKVLARSLLIGDHEAEDRIRLGEAALAPVQERPVVRLS